MEDKLETLGDFHDNLVLKGHSYENWKLMGYKHGN
jgi:hypothetical protein